MRLSRCAGMDWWPPNNTPRTVDGVCIVPPVTLTENQPSGAEEIGDVDEGQLTLDAFVSTRGRCQATSVRHSRQCKHDTLPGTDYCSSHYHLADE